MKKNIVRAFLAMGLTAGGTAHAQIPVTDVANLTQSIQNVLHQVTQITNQLNQLTELQNQVTQLTNTYNSLTGNRGLGTIANGVAEQAMRRYLPTAATAFDSLTGSTPVAGYSALQSQIATLKSTLSTLPSGFFPTGSPEQAALDKWIGELAKQQVVATSAYNNANARLPLLENLISTIGTATDPKAIAEIQARIQAESTIAQNETNKMQALLYRQRNEELQREQRSMETLSRQGRGTYTAVTYP